MLPHNRDFEETVLAHILLEPWRFGEFDLRAEDFFIEGNRILFTLMQTLEEQQLPIDMGSLHFEIEKLKLKNAEDADVAFIALNKIDVFKSSTAIASSFQTYAARLRKLSVLREYIELANRIAETAFRADSEPDWLYSTIEAELRRINGVETRSEATMDWLKSFELYDAILERRKVEKNAEIDKTWNWPWFSWNRVIGPPDPGILVLVGGPDGSGKSIVSEQVAEHWAKNGKKVLFVHFELNREVMLDRRMCRHAFIERSKLRRMDLEEIDVQRIEYANRQMMDWIGNITYLHTPGWSMDQVLREAERIHHQYGLDGIVLDYLEKATMSALQLKKFREDGLRREADDVEQIKNFCERLELRVMMLSQFSKAGKGLKAGEADRMSIRGAGEKTDRSNVVVLIQRTKTKGDDENNYDPVASIIIDKNTLGPTPRFKQYFNGAHFTITDIA